MFGTACVKNPVAHSERGAVFSETLLLHGVSSGMPVTHGDGDVDSVMQVGEHTEPGRCILIGEMHKSVGKYIYISNYSRMQKFRHPSEAA